MSDKMTFLLWPDIELVVSQENQILDTSGNELDPDWRHIDKAGHGHFANTKAKGNDRLPTLRWVSLPCTMGHGDDCDSEGFWRCGLCDEEIKPLHRWRSSQKVVPGLREITLTSRTEGRQITWWLTQALMDELGDEIRALLEQKLADHILNVEMGLHLR